MSGFDPNMPWNSVIKASSADVEFWDRELKEPALLYTMGHGKLHPSHVIPLIEPEGGVDQPLRVPKRLRNGKGKGKQQQWQYQQPNKGAKGKGKGRHPVRTKTGKYVTDLTGKELCFNWNRTAGGCANSACPNGRSHLCENCLQPHRTIDCPQKPSKGGAEVHT